MLNEAQITAFLPTVMPEAAKEFYVKTLGLKLNSEDNFALELQGQGCLLRVTTVQEFVPHPFTVMGFRIEDIESQVEILSKQGVRFETYDALDQDALGIWTAPSQARIAWFKDPDGNLLSLTQYD